MTEFNDAFLTAWQLLAVSDARLSAIVWLSLRVSLVATLVACVVGMPIGALLAVGRFPGRRVLTSRRASTPTAGSIRDTGAARVPVEETHHATNRNRRR